MLKYCSYSLLVIYIDFKYGFFVYYSIQKNQKTMKKYSLIALIGVTFLFVLNASCKKEKNKNSTPAVIGTVEPCPGIPTFTYQGQTYNTVLIGSQCWMKENLNFATGNSWCYDDDPANCGIYGRLYDWATIMNGEASSNSVPSGVQGICPDGWHLPSDAEWDIIVNYLGGYGVAGGKMKEAGYAHWYSPNAGATNESGFTALPGGYRFDGNFYVLGSNEFFWSSSEYDAAVAWRRNLYSSFEVVLRGSSLKGNGFSVRCLRD
jgi:uncharacterized protein (TIGR02145 family)